MDAPPPEYSSVVVPRGGNLPCCHDGTDGCEIHNPNHVAVFWDASLPSNIGPRSKGFIQTLLGKGNKPTPTPSPNKHDTIPQVWSLLPVHSSTHNPLPLVHPQVPYTLAFYHIHAAMTSPSPDLSALHCTGTSPRGLTAPRPCITWSITPKICPSLSPSPSASPPPTFLLAHTCSFTIPLSHGHPHSHSRHYRATHWLSSIGYRAFRPCPHMTTFRFNSVREASGGSGPAGAVIGVGYGLENVLGEKMQDQWRSDLHAASGMGPLLANVSCAMCYTDVSVRFAVRGGSVAVRFGVFKDLGAGRDPREPKWVGAMGLSQERVNIRERGDFGRLRRVFEGM
ncbi:hypothetical protein B0T24DRAFT_671630 [Lasiosphaeria ovina]|uniref:Uncharacterized protein n=1 Tax=Lasiosphaeria ovina TaxID=92902 RepID=A0AAE0MZ38_9PEZI|nr:hypothetical protein B0T24DRAFT_671630 [Lasiosphaeria ovina]